MKTLEELFYSSTAVLTGVQCQCTHIHQWNEAGWSCHPQQVSHLKTSAQENRAKRSM